MLIKKIIENGIRISIKAEEILRNTPYDEKLLGKIKKLKKSYINENDIKKILKEENEKKVIVRRSSKFKAIAKEYDADIKIPDRHITGKSTTKGEIGDFVTYFRNRYEKLAKLLKKFDTKYTEIKLGDIKRSVNEYAKIIVMVTKKQQTKKGNILLEVEDQTGIFKVVFTKNKQKLFENARNIMLDDVISIKGKVLEAFVIGDEFEWPDLPLTRERKFAENDLAVAYLSDIHFGSNNFMNKHFDKFLSWIKGENGAEEIASKLKYIIFAGDIVDGIGIYPKQDKELVVTDIYKQYSMFDEFVQQVPDYIEIIAIPGNHDAVRKGEPYPAIEKDLLTSDIIRLGNPGWATIEGLKHVIYHGNSMDNMISALPHLSYTKPEDVMEEYMKRRHFSPNYGGNLIVPERTDYLVLEDEPDVMHTGHVHKNGYKMYRGSVLINSGTFQARTEFQVRQGHVPTPAMVPVYELKTGKLRTLDFRM